MVFISFRLYLSIYSNIFTIIVCKNVYKLNINSKPKTNKNQTLITDLSLPQLPVWAYKYAHPKTEVYHLLDICLHCGSLKNCF